MVDFEISLAKGFGWSLRDIDETDIESLIPFAARMAHKTGKSEKKSQKPGQKVYCDQVDWL